LKVAKLPPRANSNQIGSINLLGIAKKKEEDLEPKTSARYDELYSRHKK